MYSANIMPSTDRSQIWIRTVPGRAHSIPPARCDRQPTASSRVATRTDRCAPNQWLVDRKPVSTWAVETRLHEIRYLGLNNFAKIVSILLSAWVIREGVAPL